MARRPSGCMVSMLKNRPSPAATAEHIAFGRRRPCRAAHQRPARRHAGAMDEAPLPPTTVETHGPWLQPADAVVNCARRKGPVDRALGLRASSAHKWRSVPSCGISSTGPSRDSLDDLDERGRADVRQVALDIDAGLVAGRSAAATWRSIGPASSSFTTRMIVTPGVAVASHHRAMDGRRAAVLGQQRRVDVDHPEPRNGEQRLRQDAPVRRDDAEIGVVSRRSRPGTPRREAWRAAGPARQLLSPAPSSASARRAVRGPSGDPAATRAPTT